MMRSNLLSAAAFLFLLGSLPSIRAATTDSNYLVTAATAVPQTIAGGQTLTLTASVQSLAAETGVNVDLQIFNSHGTKLSHTYHADQEFSAGQNRTYTWVLTVPSQWEAGRYYLSAAVFSSDWSTMLLWGSQVATFTVASVETPPPPSPSPTPSPRPPPSPPPSPSSGGTAKWVTGYYASWQTNLYPVNRIDFTALTHIVLAHWLTNPNGTLQASDLDTGAAPIISAAHGSGVKAIMMVGGSDDTSFAAAASSGNRPTLVNAILSKLTALNMDGVDLDWESNINASDFIALAQALRQANPSLIVTAPVDPTLDPGALAAGLAPYCDQVNMMSYADSGPYPGWQSWYFSALGGDGPTHPSSINNFVTKWIGSGVPASKIGIGIGFYGTGWTSPVAGPLQPINNASMPLGELPYGSSLGGGGGVLSWFYNQPGTTYSYDSGSAQQPSISIPSGITPPLWTGAPITWVTYEDEASIAAKANYVKSNGLGGTIIWTLNEGATDPITGRNPLLDAVKLGFLNIGPSPMLLQNSAKGYLPGPSIVVSGLSTGLKQVVVRWWNGNTSFDESVSSYGSYGRPSEYYIEASSDGTNWTSLTHVTDNPYSQRQFLYDFTGKGYTQVRLRVVSIVGSYGGNATVSVHSAPNNSTDSYLLLGDSVTSNCWAAADNTFPNEPFGAGVNAVRPNRYPVMTEGGIPDLLSGSLLNTTPEGIPVIRKWLQDFPTVKYVGLSYGTNDANGNVTPATYCSNMKSLVQEVIAAGKTPIIPTIVASPASAVQANAPAMNACLATLESQYPSIIKGPDLWTISQGHSVADGWFFDDLHPSLGIGCSALQNAWINTMISTLYPQ